MSTLTFKKLDKLVWDNKPKLLEDFGYTRDDQSVGLADSISGYHFGNFNKVMRAKLDSLGWGHDDDNMLVYDINTIDKVRALADKVIEAYDNTDEKWANKFWYDEMGLGSDDDVDYNGTYLHIVFDMVEVAHNHL